MTTQQTTAHSLFLQAWEKATKIEFNKEWKNGTGYLDHATNDLELKKDQFVATIDDLNRKVLLKD